MKGYNLLIACLALLSSCTNELLTEFPETDKPEAPIKEVRMATYNIHGGKGPNSEGTFDENLTAFRDLLQGEDIVCMQEVEPNSWESLKNIFADYPHRYYVEQRSTRFGTDKAGGNAILSKLPISAHSHAIVNTDPDGDKWERKAQYIKVLVGNEHQYLNLFHYHNTYNWHENNSQAEKQGFRNFLTWVVSKDISTAEMTVIIGDFNLSSAQCNQILQEDYPELRLTKHASNWVDHIYGEGTSVNDDIYQTRNALLSDHNAVWVLVCNKDC